MRVTFNKDLLHGICRQLGKAQFGYQKSFKSCCQIGITGGCSLSKQVSFKGCKCLEINR